MIVKCACQNCGQNIEFEAEHGGSFVDCPSCARPTRLLIPGAAHQPGGSRRLPFSARSVEVKSRFPWPKVIGISFAALIVILAIAILIRDYGVSQTADTAGQIMGIGITTILMAVGAVLAITLAVFWLIFPWMMYSKLNRVIEVLEQIRDQKPG